MHRAVLIALLLTSAGVAQAASIAQAQTGVIIGHPGGPMRGPVAVQVPPPKPNLVPPILASFKGTILLRRESGIFVVRSADKTAKRVLTDVYAASLSPDTRHIAYFKSRKIHLLTLAADETAASDIVLEELAGAQVEDIGWSADGTMLAYDVQSRTDPGVHVVSMATHAVQRADAGPGAISFSPDGRYVLGINAQGLTRYRLSDHVSEVVYRTPYPPNWAARFNAAGAIGMLTAIPPPPSNASDDEPDCSGAQLQLEIVVPGARTWTVPFPKDFDDVYDFDFSPDGRNVALGFGTVGCDYPGDVGAIFVVSLIDGTSRRLTPENKITLKARFSSDGNQVAYTDFTIGGSPSVFIVDVATGKTAPLVAADAYGYDEVLDWR